jgi:hypothetical protein
MSNVHWLAASRIVPELGKSRPWNWGHYGAAGCEQRLGEGCSGERPETLKRVWDVSSEVRDKRQVPLHTASFTPPSPAEALMLEPSQAKLQRIMDDPERPPNSATAPETRGCSQLESPAAHSGTPALFAVTSVTPQ